MSKVVKKVLVSMPEPLLKRLDSRTKSSKRSRSAEVCFRLEQSLRSENKRPRDLAGEQA